MQCFPKISAKAAPRGTSNVSMGYTSLRWSKKSPIKTYVYGKKRVLTNNIDYILK